MKSKISKFVTGIIVAIVLMGLTSCSKSKRFLKKNFVEIPGMNIVMLKTEVTQKLYKSVMNENPSEFIGDNNPVERVSVYDAIYFCNLLSIKYGYFPVYEIRGTTDVRLWDYTPHNDEIIEYKISIDPESNGFRLPSTLEWAIASQAGQDYVHSGSNNLDEVAWFRDNSDYTTHPVAQKKPNNYGLYDMNGNVEEWACNYEDEDYSTLGGCIYFGEYLCGVYSGVSGAVDGDARGDSIGFRIVRSMYD